jgi:hypothetical protein
MNINFLSTPFKQAVVPAINPKTTTTFRSGTQMPQNADRFVSSVIPETMKALTPKTIDLKQLYQSWQLEIVGNQLLLTQNGQTTVVHSHPEVPALQAIKSLFKPAGQVLYRTEQGQNGDCHLLATLQEMMMTGNHVESLINAVSVEVDPLNPRNKLYTLTFYDEQKRPKAYSYSLDTLIHKKHLPEDLQLATSYSHQNLITLVSLALRPFTFETGFNNCKPTLFLGPYNIHNPIWTDGGYEGFLLTALDPKKQVMEYCIHPATQELYCSENVSCFKGWVMPVAEAETQEALDKSLPSLLKEDTVYLPLNFEEIEMIKRLYPNALTAISSASSNTETQSAEAAIKRNHAYTFLALDKQERTVTVVDPHDATKLIVLKATELPFTHIGVATNPEN